LEFVFFQEEVDPFGNTLTSLLNWTAVGGFCANQLTPWSRILPEKLTRPKLLKNCPEFYGTRKFINAITTALLELCAGAY
jgi:hypothetical protein